jgi:hypothetical protein
MGNEKRRLGSHSSHLSQKNVKSRKVGNHATELQPHSEARDMHLYSGCNSFHMQLEFTPFVKVMNGTVCSKLICPITGNSQSYRSQPSLRQRRPRKITFSPPPTTVQDKRARESRLYWIRQRACAAYREECGRDLSKDESLLQKLVNCQSVDFYS